MSDADPLGAAPRQVSAETRDRSLILHARLRAEMDRSRTLIQESAAVVQQSRDLRCEAWWLRHPEAPHGDDGHPQAPDATETASEQLMRVIGAQVLSRYNWTPLPHRRRQPTGRPAAVGGDDD